MCHVHWLEGYFVKEPRNPPHTRDQTSELCPPIFHDAKCMCSEGFCLDLESYLVPGYNRATVQTVTAPLTKYVWISRITRPNAHRYTSNCFLSSTTK